MKKLLVFVCLMFLFSASLLISLVIMKRDNDNSIQVLLAEQKEGENKEGKGKVVQKNSDEKSSESDKSSGEQNEDENKKTEEKKREEERKKVEEEKHREELLKAVYKIGDKGEGVRFIQERLKLFGHNITLDGNFGIDTYFAVSDFQYRAKLLCDGVVGAETMTKLNQSPTEELIYKRDVPAFAADSNTANTTEEVFINSQSVTSRTDFYIYVDTSNCKVNIFKGYMDKWTLVRSMSCSIGGPSTPTVKGRFTLTAKGPVFRVDSKIICKYFSQIHENYLFHSVLLDNKGNVIDGRLGKRISHGCIRLAVEDAKYIYEDIPAGTSVWVK